MAITSTHAKLFRSLPLPRGGTLLEIGEANWYGDCEPDFPYIPVHDVRDKPPEPNLFEIAKSFYDATFSPSRIVSVDFHGTPQALRTDLNQPLPRHACDERYRVTDYELGTFDVVINHGTAEHIFNIGQVFRTMHDCCEVGGLMIHDAPFTGWIDHGFYCLQPTLFYDLAIANGYEVVKVAIHEIRSKSITILEYREHAAELAKAGQVPDNAMLFVCFRKVLDAGFRLPIQGYYAQALSEAGNKAWSELR